MAPEPHTDKDKDDHKGRDAPDKAANTTVDAPVICHNAPHKAGVIIRASVEHVDVAGDTELTVSVKWPASAFCVPTCANTAKTSDAAGDARNLPGNAPQAKIRKVTGMK